MKLERKNQDQSTVNCGVWRSKVILRLCFILVRQ